MSMKMKGLLKGLRYISQIFEEEEEQEIQIGFPTDVKHVAHIGCDGPTTNAPSWINEFKSPDEAQVGDAKENEECNGSSKDISNQRSVRDSPARDLPALPRASRRQASIDSTASESPLGSPTQKSKELKQSRRRQSGSSSKESKDPASGSRSSRQKEVSSPRGGESSSQCVRNLPKKSRRKKSKDGEGSVIASSRSKGHSSSIRGSSHGSEDGSTRSYTNGTYKSSSLTSLHEEEVKV